MRKRRRKVNKKRVLFVIALVILAGALYCHFDTQALPKLVDVASAIVGDKPILLAEKTYYALSGWLNERFYSAKLGLGIEKQHKLVMAPVPEPGGLSVARKPRAEGEGQWLDKGPYLRTFVYPETNLDSIADVVWFKPKLTELHLVCGTKEPLPGGPGRIPAADKASAIMAFSGGFKYRHDHGGMLLGGRLLRPMKAGMGTLVIFRDGEVKAGKWGRDWTAISPDMRDARQGFMLIDNGKFCDSPLFNIYAQDKQAYVRRSAIGVTRDGAVVYATGNDLSAGGLARAMIAAGVVSAIHLEMNLSRVLCGVFEHKAGETKLLPLTPRCCDPRPLQYTRERDFFYVEGKG